ncbi:MAG: T9SS type A sorting domain-containing protein, partial [Calditrichaeota bacterium]|nr:T9SS type A sorting domain-containing protein [Calditrichota bacterium]
FLPENAYTSLRIYNLLGEVVEELVGADLPAGRHRYQWNADRQASGVYYYRLTARKFSAVKKLVLLR